VECLLLTPGKVVMESFLGASWRSTLKYVMSYRELVVPFGSERCLFKRGALSL